MYSPHTVTLYHLIEDDTTAEVSYNKTVLKGVFLETSQGTSTSKNGASDTDNATLYIPFGVNAYDPATGSEKAFLGNVEWKALNDKGKYWTLETGGKTSSHECFFVKGEVVDDSGYAAMRGKYSDVYDITSVITRDYGSKRMQHWQVGGR